MTELSPAAQAVLDAINKELDEAPWDLTFIAGSAAAAALCAAADQVVPIYDLPLYADDATHEAWAEREDVRDDLLKIADELRGK